jgi:serine/threonine protein kinase
MKELIKKAPFEGTRRLLRHMLTKNPEKRYSIDKVVMRLKKLIQECKVTREIREYELALIPDDAEDERAPELNNASWYNRQDPSRC